MKKSASKICKQCGKRKRRDLHFHKNPGSQDGYRNICKSCRGGGVTEYPFFSDAIVQLCKHHKYSAVTKFGYFLGVIIYLRPKEILAFSVLTDTVKGSNVFENHIAARAWLCQIVIRAGDRIAAGLMGKVKG